MVGHFGQMAWMPPEAPEISRWSSRGSFKLCTVKLLNLQTTKEWLEMELRDEVIFYNGRNDHEDGGRI